MRLSRSQYIVKQFGSMLFGFVPATIIAFVVDKLWSQMALLSFITCIFSWVAFGVSSILREKGSREGAFTTFSEELQNVQGDAGRPESHATFVGGIFLGVTLAPIVGGIIGLFWPGGRWPVFFTILVIWIGIYALTLKGPRGDTIQDS